MNKNKVQTMILFQIAAIFIVLIMPKILPAVTVELKESVKADEIPGAELIIEQQEGQEVKLAEPPAFAEFFGEIFDLSPRPGTVEADATTLEEWIKQYNTRIAQLEEEEKKTLGMYFFCLNMSTLVEDPQMSFEAACMWLNHNAAVNEKLKRFKEERAEYEKALADLQSKKASAGSGEGEGCFQAQTRVLLADGCAVEISKVKVGEMVKSYNLQKGIMEDKEVLKLYSFPTQGYYLINESLKATKKHPFLLAGPERNWKKAKDLEIGDKVHSTKGVVTVKSIKFVQEKGMAYNFLVKDNKAYIVSSGGKYYVVHNGL